ncbi:MAG: hypothetical protein ACR2PO_00700 [Methyloligellaceae bacterium]
MTQSDGAIRIAMWSGPRNISTALMRSFENRPDTVVLDEPFYAAYLEATGLDHPVRDAVISAGQTDPMRVVECLSAEPTGGARVFYQKHMTHHMLPHFPREWLLGMVNCFLIRRPEDVVASYAAKRADVTFADLGFAEQAEIFDSVAQRLGAAPPVIEGREVLMNPERLLKALCAVCGIAFTNHMLQWPTGRRGSDGIWAAHWYGEVERSVGFGPPSPPAGELPVQLARLAERALPIYERLYALRLTG